MGLLNISFALAAGLALVPGIFSHVTQTPGFAVLIDNTLVCAKYVHGKKVMQRLRQLSRIAGTQFCGIKPFIPFTERIANSVTSVCGMRGSWGKAYSLCGHRGFPTASRLLFE